MVIIQRREGFTSIDGMYYDYIAGAFESDGQHAYCNTALGTIVIPVSEITMALVVADGVQVPDSEHIWFV
jgi:hypothetical protein